MKLLTWNVQAFLGIDGVADVARVIGHARALCDFDVLCLQEVAVHFSGLAGTPPQDQAAAVAALLPGYEVFFAPAADYRCGPQGERERFGNLLASRLPVRMVEHHPLPLLAEAGVPSVRRMCTAALVQAESGPLTILNAHLEYHSGAQRALQAQHILRIHQENCELVGATGPAKGLYRAPPRSPRTILCGDFNCDAASSEFRGLLRGSTGHSFRDVFTTVHGDAPRPATFGVYDSTWVAQAMACDHILATQDVAPLAVRIETDGATRFSDHQPVYAHWEGL
jgi:endonuclease/exonuclease/phosphatase family metal-dependent hydrolase